MVEPHAHAGTMAFLFGAVCVLWWQAGLPWWLFIGLLILGTGLNYAEAELHRRLRGRDDG